jgi:hypothetical protein
LGEKAGCRVQSGPLGTDYHAAVERVEKILLPTFDEWRTGGASSETSLLASAPGTLDWMFAEYRADRGYTKLDPKSKRNHETGFKLVGGYILKDGKRLGEKRVAAIDTALIDITPKLHCGLRIQAAATLTSESRALPAVGGMMTMTLSRLRGATAHAGSSPPSATFSSRAPAERYDAIKRRSASCQSPQVSRTTRPGD